MNYPAAVAHAAARKAPAAGAWRLTAIVLWLLVLLAGYPAYKDYQYKSLIKTITNAGVRAVSKADGSHELDFRQTEPGSFNRLRNQPDRLPSVVKLGLAQDKDLINLNLEKLAQLQSLTISGNGSLRGIAGLEKPQNLRDVFPDERLIVLVIDKLTHLARLQKLKLRGNPQMRTLAQTLNQNRQTTGLPPVKIEYYDR